MRSLDQIYFGLDCDPDCWCKVTKVGDMLPEWWLKNMMTSEVRIFNRMSRPLPAYAHGSDQDAGMDLMSAVDVTLDPGEVRAVDTGIALEIPPGIKGEICSRSGLSLKGVVVNNAPATIDPSYRGPIMVILKNQNDKPVTFLQGDRIAQLIFVPYVQVKWSPVDSLSELKDSSRGERGLGSTGLSAGDLLGMGGTTAL